MICDDTSYNYGEKYRLKTGLLTTDEMMLAGFSKAANITNSYLKKSYWWLSFSPNVSYLPVDFEVFGGDDYIMSYNIHNSGEVRPVINLNSDTQVTSGNGTASKPSNIKLFACNFF